MREMLTVVWSVVKAVIFAVMGFVMLFGAVTYAILFVLRIIGEILCTGFISKFKEEVTKDQLDRDNK